MVDISDWRNLCVASIVSQIGEDLPDAVWHRAKAQAVEAVDFAASRGADITQCGRDCLSSERRTENFGFIIEDSQNRKLH